jgi:hypothetical protein
VEQWEEEEGLETTLLNNSIQDSVGNEENGFPIPDHNKTIMSLKSLAMTTKTCSKKKSFKK